MKLPNPKQKENGKWLVQVMVDGKRTSKEFYTKDEAIYWAAGLKTRQIEEHRNPKGMPLSAAVNKYIEVKSSVLSPSTIRGYQETLKNRMTDIADTRLGDLTQEKVQRWVNKLAKTCSPKTVANAHGLLSAVLAEYKPSMTLRTTLPQKVKADIQIPTTGDLKAIAEACKGTQYELPIMLAIWLGLRQSEILGLTWDCVDKGFLHIKQAIVLGPDGAVTKGTKTFAGKRKLPIPQYIQTLIDAQPKTSDHIVNINGKAIYAGFTRICKKAGVPHYRFHDLRHVNASVMLSLNVPDKYAMRRMGHATNNMLKTVYQHTMDEKEKEVNEIVDAYFQSIISPGE